MKLRWLIRSVLAGAAGTVALTLAYGAERRLRPRVAGPLDYDDSLVPGQIVAAIMHLPHVTAREEHELGMALRWSYSSVFGLWHGFLRRRAGEPLARLAFGATLMSATLTLFPLLGRTSYCGDGRRAWSPPRSARKPHTLPPTLRPAGVVVLSQRIVASR